ncbi:MAG: prenyltransferase/squalene oxidase repeat-containing protein [Planctomycetota bacterium]|nr:prenyltransferase/squalene oxidase repeat-containing protein [Planctomycetota bacterium]
MRSLITLMFLLVVSSSARVGSAAEPASPAVDVQAKRQQLVDRGIKYLLEKGQAADGSFSAKTGAGVTALCTTAMLRNGLKTTDPGVAKALKYLELQIRDDGGIYSKDSAVMNYETALAIVCFKEANEGGKYDKTIAAADKFLKKIQWDESENHDKSSVNYGGAGYGKKNRPDLSNTSFLMEALVAAGNGPDDEAVRKALIFVSRCQNLASPENTTADAAKVNDGGFYYTVANEGESFAGETPDGGLRSYGSMTYAGLKSMIYAGLKPNDPRVKAATAWLRKHYDLKANPGLGDMGLYYYYHTMAKALSVLGEDKFVDDKGVAHDWRAELVAELGSRQQADGSWVNTNARWLETDANLVTGYVLLVLSYCK